LVIVIIVLIIILRPANKMSNAKYKKVLLIGIDGMDPEISEKLMSEGKLPNFKKLADDGTFINLNTSYPPHSPVAWTTIATGTNPGKHNVFDFIRRNPENYMPELSLSKSASGLAGTEYSSYVKSDSFWRLTSNAGIQTDVIRWPVTFPPERIEGNMLSGLGVPDIKGFLSGYSFYTENEIKQDETSADKVINIEREGNSIKTRVYGPRTTKNNEVVEINVPMNIEIVDGKAKITVQEKSYLIEEKGWSYWIKAEFKISMIKKVSGIFKAYLKSTSPFEMYITAVQIDPKKPVVDISYPKQYSKELAKEIGLYYTLGSPEETGGYIDERIDEEAFKKQIYQIEKEREAMFWERFNKFNEKEQGLLAFVFDASDRVQHCFWEEKVLEGNDDELSINPFVEEYFIEKDKFLEKVLKEIDNETAILIVSDHGFTSFERAVNMNTWLYENGFLSLKKEITDENGGALFSYVDWENTKAYSVGFNSIYLNLKGREKNGIVENKEQVVDEIIEKLKSFVDEKTGKNVVYKSYKSEEIHSGDYLKNSPDIIIGFNSGYRMDWKSPIGAFSKEIIVENKKVWDGDHLVDPFFVPGILFSNIKIKSNSSHQIDIAPTVLDMLGVKIPKNIDGKSLLE
jgi:predicted AlkP superfamily phosphohydrolase/phosphomutase